MEWMLWVVVVATLALAVGMSVLAWRMLRGDRRRSDARAAMLRHVALEEAEPFDAGEFESEAGPEIRWQDAAMPPPVFAAVEQSRAPSRHWVVGAVVVVFAALGAGTVYGLYPEGPTLADAGSPLSGLIPRRAETRPLELLSLSYQMDDGDFVVTGLVQNPHDGRPSPSVLAVVYVFNTKGDYFASGKAALEFATLAPGAESPFVVRLPKAADVSRFRVGFRTSDGAVVAHVDRRGQPIESTTAAGSSSSEGP